MLTKSHFHILDISAIDICTFALSDWSGINDKLKHIKRKNERDDKFRLKRKPSLNKIAILCMIYFLVKGQNPIVIDNALLCLLLFCFAPFRPLSCFWCANNSLVIGLSEKNTS